MKKTKIAELKTTELPKELAAKRESLRSFRFAAAGAKGKNVKEGVMLRKDIARILTAMNAHNA